MAEQAPMENSMTCRRPANFREREEQAGNLQSQREVDPYIKLYRNRTLMDNLACTFCQRYLSVAPIFFEYKNNQLHKVCGRCYRDPALQVHTRRDMLQEDRVYQKLLPYLIFNCSHKPCDVRLEYRRVEEHEGNCHFKLQTQSENDEPQHDLSEQGVNREKIFFSIPNVKELSCNTCGKPLSVFPVLSNGTDIICGSCERSKSGSDWTQQRIYQIMVPFIKFPCNNKSCTQGLKVDEVKEHERTCRSTNILCPSISCREPIPPVELSIHIRRYHLSECRDRLEVKEQTSLFNIYSEPYIVFVKVHDDDEQQFSCEVYGIDEKQYDDLHLEIVDEDDGSVLESLRIQVVRMRQTPDRVQIKNRRKNAFIRLVTRENFEGVALDAEAREHLECKVCYHYMTRSIFTCENGHPICDMCKEHVNFCCPMCRATLADNRHWQLENKAAKLKFPCRFQDDKNCRVALTPKFLYEHEDRCSRRHTDPTTCFVAECRIMLNSYRYGEFCNHYARHHRDVVIHSGRKEIFEWSTEYPQVKRYMTLFFDGEIFFVMFDCGGTAGFSFGVSHMASFLSKQYKYTLELYNDGRTLEREGTCGWLSSTTDLHLEPELVEDMLNRGSSTIGWIIYRVKVEEDRNRQLLRSDLVNRRLRQ